MKKFVKHKIEFPYKDKLEIIAGTIQTDVILFSGVLDSTTWKCFLGTIPTRDRLTMIIRGSGGFYYNDDLQVTLGQHLRNNYSTINIIVMDYAKSALSLLSLSCDNLYLLKSTSGIGTIDPKVLPKSCFEIVSPGNLEISDGRLTISNCCIDNSIKNEIEFSLNYSYESIKAGKIINHDKKFIRIFRTMLGIEEGCGVDFRQNHSKVIIKDHLIKIGLNISKLDDSLTFKILEVYELLMNELQKKKDNFEYYVFEIQ